MGSTADPQQVITALHGLTTFPPSSYVNRLFNKARLMTVVAPFTAELDPQPTFGPDPDSALLDGCDASKFLNLLAEQAAANALAALDGAQDPFGLAKCANAINAAVVQNNVMVQISSLLYGEHVNQFLEGKQLPNLATLSKQPGFLDSFLQTVQKENFLKGENQVDQLNPEFGVTPNIDDEFPSSPSGKTLTIWVNGLLAQGVAPKDIVIFSAKASSTVFGTSAEQLAPNPPGTLAEKLEILQSQQSLKNAVSQLTASDYGEWASICESVNVGWGELGSKWNTSVDAAAATMTYSETKTRTHVHSSIFYVVDHYSYTGQVVADWINAGYKAYASLFNSVAPSVQKFTGQTTEPISCFVTGTILTTKGGEKPIECVREGDIVLTDAVTQAFGVVSDEHVCHNVDAQLLGGFNGEEPFFTLGHVFHTTTGLRAYDPIVAQLENSWLEVGKLREGHVVYRLSEDAKTYELVQVKSINLKYVEKTAVYGLHLREGLRSYHANGYKVALNYPEVTIKSIASALRGLPRAQRLQMLSTIKELQPIFTRFGMKTIDEVLSRELSAKVSGKRRSGRAQNIANRLLHARRTFKLQPPPDSDNSVAYELPSVRLEEGVVLVNGEVQHRAVIESGQGLVRWSRSLPEAARTSGYSFEHGYLKIIDHGVCGQGALLLSNNSQADVPTDYEATGVALPFIATKVSQRAGLLDNSSADTSQTQSIIAVNPRRIPSLDLSALEAPHTRPELAAKLGADDDDDDDMTYTVEIDTDAWAWKTDAPSSITNSSPFGDVIFHDFTTDTGYTFPIIKVPLLDDLCAAYNAANPSPDGSTLPSLYSSTVEETDDGFLLGTVFLDSAATLAGCCDQPTPAPGGSYGTTNLTFKQTLGSDIVLPMLFSSFYVQVSWDSGSVAGAFYEWNPDYRGSNGVRHYCDSNGGDFSVRSAAVARRAANAFAIESARSSPEDDQSHLPAPVTEKLQASTPLSPQDLLSSIKYDDTVIHNTCQTFIQQMMYYHMDGNTRDTFINVSKPTVGPNAGQLPSALADGLDPALKTWFANVYAPAYISITISQNNMSTKVTSSDAAKIWYWWSGSGDHCLSSTAEYNQINELATVQAMFLNYGNTLNRYVNDSTTSSLPDPKLKGLTGGKKWATLMYDSYTNPKNTNAMKGLLKKPISGGTNMVNKVCNILYALDPPDDFASQLFTAILVFEASEQSKNQYTGADDPNNTVCQTWLNDAMSNLGLRVLQNDPTLPPEVRGELQADLVAYEKQHNLDESLDDKVRMQQILDSANELVVNLAEWMSCIGETVAKLGPVLKGMWGFKRIGRVYDKVVQKISDSIGSVILKGFSTIVMNGFLIAGCIMSFLKWGDQNAEEHADLILTSLSVVLKTAEDIFDTWKSYKKYQANQTAKQQAQQDADAAKLDAQTQANMNSEETKSDLVAKVEQEGGEGSFMEKAGARMTENGPVVNAPPPEEDIQPMEEPIEKLPDEELPADIPAGGKTAARKFASAVNWLKVVQVFIGIGITVCLGIALKANWSHLTTAGQWLETIQVVTQGLTVLTDAASIVGEAAEAAGLEFAEATFFVALPYIGAIVALIGLVIAIVLIFVKTNKTTTTDNKVDDYVNGTTVPLIAPWDNPPPISLTYTVSPGKLTTGQVESVVVTGMNNTSSQVVLTGCTVSFQGGDDKGGNKSTCLVTDTTMAMSDEPSHNDMDGYMYVDPASLTASSVSNYRGPSVNSFDVNIVGLTDAKTNPLGQIILNVNQALKATITGKINTFNTAVSIMSVTETKGPSANSAIRSGDKVQFPITLSHN